MPNMMPPQMPALPSDIRQAALKKLSAQLSKAQAAHGQVSDVMGEFQHLANQGDTVTQDDLVDAAAAIVSHGGDPRQVATMLASAPDSGPTLASWVGQQLAQMAQLHAKVGGVVDATRHKLLQGAMSHIAQSVREGVQQAQQSAPAPFVMSNPLIGAQPNG